jgi:dihydroxyacetone kinase-like predicted kinase
VDDLRRNLAELGDSVAVVAVGDDTWKVHVHVNDVGAAIEAGVDAGRPHRISVIRFSEQVGGSGASAVVAVAPGAGLTHLFESEGVRVVEPAAGGAPSVEEVVAAIRSTQARQLVLLPNEPRAAGVAEAAADQARADGIRVSVVPTRSPVQGLAAIAVHDRTRRFDDDVVAMAEAAAATRYAELVIARDQALTAVGICQPGDVLGLIDGDVVEIGRGLLAVAFNVVDRLLGVGAELMTVVVGDGAPRRAGELIEAHVRGRAPLTDVTVYAGGHPDVPVIIGVE